MDTRFVSAKEAVGTIPDNTLLGIGGSMKMAPMRLIQEIIRQNKRQLRVICAPAGGRRGFGNALL